jgi:hypothetical protein
MFGLTENRSENSMKAVPDTIGIGWAASGIPLHAFQMIPHDDDDDAVGQDSQPFCDRAFWTVKSRRLSRVKDGLCNFRPVMMA